MSTDGKIADLEISLHRRDGERYAVEMRLNQPGSAAEDGLEPGWTSQKALSPGELTQSRDDDRDYGTRLGEGLLASEEVRRGLAKARGATEKQGVSLRVRLYVGHSAPELHHLRWETLHDPETGTPLLTGEQLLFSRYLSSYDWQPVRLRPERTSARSW